jgi:anti-sigma regulatory factor (Ser/Thr protein kinase)
MFAGSAADGSITIEFTIANTRFEAGIARRRFRNFASDSKISPHVAADLELAVGEGLANAAEHGQLRGHKGDGKQSGIVIFVARLTSFGIAIQISDDGPGFVPRADYFALPSPVEDRGYGLFLMHGLVDHVEIDDHGRTVRLFKYFRHDHARDVPHAGATGNVVDIFRTGKASQARTGQGAP